MKQNVFMKLAIIGSALLLCTAAYSQQGSGSDKELPKGGTATTVALLAPNSLQPLVTADEDITAEVRTSYKGTRVHNTAETNGLEAREYIWSGTVWTTPEHYEKQLKKTPGQPATTNTTAQND